MTPPVTQTPYQLAEEEDEEARWEKFDPMREHFENSVENSYTIGSVGGTLPKKLLTYSKQNSKHATEIKLYVSKIPKHVTESGLRNIFSRYGKVLYVHIAKQSRKDSSTHFGFVSLSSLIEADRAIQSLNNAPPFFLHLEFECSDEEKKERALIETVTLNFDRITSVDLNEGDEKCELEGDFSIKENIYYSPGVPLQNIDPSLLPSSVDDLSPYHLYEGRQRCSELYEPYLVWETSNSEDVSHKIALKHYIPSMNAGDIIQDVCPELFINNKTTPVSTASESEKSFGVQGTRSIQSCTYCRRRVFETSPVMCRCGVIYDGVQCQHKHWPEHKPLCIAQPNHNEIAEGATHSNEEEKHNFDRVLQGFQKIYLTGGTVLDKLPTNSAVNIIVQLWWDSDSILVTVTNEVLAKKLYDMDSNIKQLADAIDSEVQIGQLVGVLLGTNGLEIYVRGIVACKTRLGLIGVLVLELGSFVLTPSVKLIPSLSQYREGAFNVHCTVVSKDDNFVCKSRLWFTRLKDSNKFRAFDPDYNSCTVELSPYMPSPELIPLSCVTIENKAKVIITAFHSSRALYIQPLDMKTQIRCKVLASEVNQWCTNNHQYSNKNWVPKKNQIVAIRQSNGEYTRGQVIGTVTPKRSEKVIQERTDSIEMKYYLVSLIDTGNNMKVPSDNLVALPNHLKRDPCYSTKISLKNSNLVLNSECFIYLNLLEQNKTPLIVEFLEEKFMTAELTDASGNNVTTHLEFLTALPWHTSRDGVATDPTKSGAVLSLASLKVPVYPVSRGDCIQLKLLNHFDQTYASMLVLNKEEHHYVLTELSPCMREYCAQLSMDKYNPRIGGYCLAYCRELKLWTRAHCEKSSDVHGHCYLFLVDYGVHAHIPISDIRPCHSLFTEYHSLAFIAYIPEFETTELSHEDIMKKYSSHEYTVIQVINCDEQHNGTRVVLAL